MPSHMLCLDTAVTGCTNMKLTLGPTKTPFLFIKHFYIVHFPFTPFLHPSLSSHLAISLFVSSSPLLGCFNAFTPPLHSCGCFIHQSRHYSTNPTASSFAPLHLPLHHPPPSTNTWSVPGGLYTPSSSAPLLPFTESLEVSLLLIF